jgi:hypothetical protein
MYRQILLLVSLSFSLSANAVIVNTLGGKEYQWLELSHTLGLSRYEVQLRLSDPNDSIYGYQYASRSLVEDLFFSYVSWNGVDGIHGSRSTVDAISAIHNDFGVTDIKLGGDIDSTYQTVDNVTININSSYDRFLAWYGDSNECNSAIESCYAQIRLYKDKDGNPTGASIRRNFGWDSSPEITPSRSLTHLAKQNYGSFLVAPSSVPVPAAFWLFGSALLGLAGIKRKK